MNFRAKLWGDGLVPLQVVLCSYAELEISVIMSPQSAFLMPIIIIGKCLHGMPSRLWWYHCILFQYFRRCSLFHCSSMVCVKAHYCQFLSHCHVCDGLTHSALFCIVSRSWPRQDHATPLSKLRYCIRELRSHRTENHKRKYESSPTQENLTKSLSYNCFL